MDTNRSKLRFHCPVSLSDTTGTWKNVYLSDNLAIQVFGLSVQFLHQDDS